MQNLKQTPITIALLFLVAVFSNQNRAKAQTFTIERGIGITDSISIDTAMIIGPILLGDQITESSDPSAGGAILSDAKIETLKTRHGITIIKDKIETERDSIDVVDMIRFDKKGFLTGKMIEIGMPENLVRERYGRPLDRKKASDDSFELLYYHGIVFKIVDHMVKAIIIVPIEKAAY